MVWFLSVEESDKVLKGDGAGMNTLMLALRKELGKDLFDKINLNINPAAKIIHIYLLIFDDHL